MAWRVVQAGEGDARPFIVIYHATAGSNLRPTFVDDRLRAAAGRSACIVNYTAPVDPETISTGGAYLSIGATSLDGQSKFLAWNDIEAKFAQNFAVTKRLCGGFSAGCQGVRTQLAAGAPLDGVLAIDGIHGDAPAPLPEQTIPWAVYAQSAALGLDDKQFLATCTRIDPKGFLPDRVMLQYVTGMGPFEPGDSPDDPRVYRKGNCYVYSYPGNDAEAHARQLQVTLPRHLNEMLVRMNVLDPRGPEAVAAAALAGSRVGGTSADGGTKIVPFLLGLGAAFLLRRALGARRA